MLIRLSIGYETHEKIYKKISKKLRKMNIENGKKLILAWLQSTFYTQT